MLRYPTKEGMKNPIPIISITNDKIERDFTGQLVFATDKQTDEYKKAFLKFCENQEKEKHCVCSAFLVRVERKDAGQSNYEISI